MHNRPLLMAGSLEDIPVSRIMLDCGSAINIIPLKMLLKLGYTINDLSPTNVMIQGFTQSGQQALGTIRLRLMIEDMMTSVTFHVIDAITSTNVLLGRPWLHEHKVVPSIWLQCFKYKTPHGETKRIFANTKPFTTTEAFYADSKFDLEPTKELRKPAPTPPDQMAFSEKRK